MRLEGLNTGLFRAGDRLCCAISGGADSTALLLALLQANAARDSLGVVLSAVHVHHGLRGAEADGDEAFVRELCARLKVPLTVERVDTAARQTAEGEGMEEAARVLRYDVFSRLLREAKVDAVVTGHTLDDQAETVMLKLLRGAWTEGLGGISPVRELAATPGTSPMAAGMNRGAGGERVMRPMLQVRRRDVEAYLRGCGQVWREDSSNEDRSLTRNRVRHELMPLLRSFNPAADEVLARTSAIARDEESFWQAEVARVLPGLLLPGRPTRGGGRAVSTAVGERALAMELERLKALAPALRRRVLRAAAARLGCRISADETAKLLALAGLDGSFPAPRIGARLELSAGLRAERSARELRLSRIGT